MSKKGPIFATTLRLDTRQPEEEEAVAHLRNRDKAAFPSYSDVVMKAVNEYFARRQVLADDPYLETRQKEDAFLRKIEERVEQAIWEAEARGFSEAMRKMQFVPSTRAPVPLQEALADDESFDAAMDFIDNL